MSILELKNLTIQYRGKFLVKNISLAIKKGEWFALIGESGSGKSVTASSIGALLPDKLQVSEGEIIFQGKNMRTISNCDVRKMRGKNIAYVFQDYQNAFTPFIRIGKQMDEMIKCHESIEPQERKDMILNSLTEVGLDAERMFNSYPFQLSGGQLQRTAIAQATLLKPELLIADEPTTALDAVTAAKVLKLLADIKDKLHCTILFITHDLRCVKRFADRVAIMNAGEIVESGNKNEVLMNPQHPYTRELFASVPPLRNVPERLSVKNFREYVVAREG